MSQSKHLQKLNKFFHLLKEGNLLKFDFYDDRDVISIISPDKNKFICCVPFIDFERHLKLILQVKDPSPSSIVFTLNPVYLQYEEYLYNKKINKEFVNSYRH